MITANDRKVFVMALVLVALMSIFVPIGSAASQIWYFYDDHSLDTTAPTTGTFVIAVRDWDSGYWEPGPAQCAISIDADTWPLYLDYNAPVAGEIDIKLWLVSKNPPHPDVLIASVDNIAISESHNTQSVNLDGSIVDFLTGDYLVIFIYWDPDSGTTGLTVNCNGTSTFTSPSSDPGFPVPEMSSLALFSVGLIALAGYVVYRRRQI